LDQAEMGETHLRSGGARHDEQLSGGLNSIAGTDPAAAPVLDRAVHRDAALLNQLLRLSPR